MYIRQDSKRQHSRTTTELTAQNVRTIQYDSIKSGAT